MALPFLFQFLAVLDPKDAVFHRELHAATITEGIFLGPVVSVVCNDLVSGKVQ